MTLLAGGNFTTRAQTGGVGIGTTTPNGQFEVAAPGIATATDQQSIGGNSNTQASSYWQSFTAGSSGQLVQLAVYGGAGNNSGAVVAPALLEVFVGTGTGGAVLASQNFDLAGYVDNTTPTTVNFSTPGAVVAGQVYTFRVSLVNPGPGVYGLASVCTNNCYAGGTSSINAGFDANFQTVLGTPGGVQSRLLVKNGNVGIGTIAPAATLHVGGAASTVRIDGLAGSGSRVVSLASDGSLTSAPMPADAQTLSLVGNTLRISGSNSTVTLPGGISSAANGLTLAGNIVYLGGPLTQATTISQGSNAFGFTGAAGVGIGTAAPAASAQLEVASTTKGLLPPRLSTAQRDAIGGPAVGLMLYNSDTKKLEVWNGTRWTETLTTTEDVYQGPARTFTYTGGVQTYTVPAGVTSLTIDALGAQGGEVSGLGGGGPGARVQTTLTVTPGEVLSVLVGGAGFPPFSAGPGAGAGYNGGGGGSQSSGGGGGATDIRRGSATLNDRLVVAGGGGGAGSCTGGVSYAGGGGGAPNGGNGAGSPTYNQPGLGATQTAGGAGGFNSISGSFGQGGGSFTGSSGGGGGYYGGGGGTCSGAGGGSSWVLPAGTSGTTMTAATNSGNGQLTLTPGPSRPAPVLDGANFVNLPNTATASNGLTKTGNDIALGGTLSQTTTIANAGFALNVTGTGATTFGGSVGIGSTAAPAGGLQVVTGNAGVGNGVAGAVLSGAPGSPPNLELRGSSSTTNINTTPYIDFAENNTVDYSTRLLSSGGVLNVAGAGSAGQLLNVSGGATVAGNLRRGVRLCPVNQGTPYALTAADILFDVFKVANNGYASTLTLPAGGAGQVAGQELTIYSTATTAFGILGTNTDNTAVITVQASSVAGIHAVKFMWDGYWIRVQ